MLQYISCVSPFLSIMKCLHVEIHKLSIPTCASDTADGYFDVTIIVRRRIVQWSNKCLLLHYVGRCPFYAKHGHIKRKKNRPLIQTGKTPPTSPTQNPQTARDMTSLFVVSCHFASLCSSWDLQPKLPHSLFIPTMLWREPWQHLHLLLCHGHLKLSLMTLHRL